MKLDQIIAWVEIRSAIERKVRTAIADQTNQWKTDDYIKAVVKNEWQVAVDKLVRDELANSEQIKAKIRTSIEVRLRSQITALMKEKK